MAKRPRRTELPPDPAGVVRALRTCRDVLITGVLMKTIPFGTTYKLALVALDAVAALADHLTGVKGYFSDIGSGATQGQADQQREQLARENGEKPWR